MGCLFCEIIKGEVPSQVVLENEHALAFEDLKPVAPTHCLVIPKKHMDGIAAADDAEALGQTLLLAKEVAAKKGLVEGGYRVVINQGPNAGQTVFHLHVHVIGGRAMSWPPG
jgi:histidine triad (HIT) family protein